ncbi:QacE family quaternary ammonium compound efflux SMR transporter [Fulvimarina endophytica]|uniref:Guanidinium exporter n=1 Tax=Fulvimarina endophytica TaxID=2293836 RepID=A0A371X565_9HYPH|nr:multidrug efflux SMR transporter [Fulvimarina endophytica]RFC64359.1 QacE family quaternary ammonium compound efflux SMR transporter [Fulvimarina endophytica]
MAWVILVLAGLLETVWAFTMKLSEGFTKPWPTVVTIATMIASFALLATAMRTLPLGTAYTVWTGIGAIGAFVVGILFLGESANPGRLIGAGLVVAGLAVLNLSSSS